MSQGEERNYDGNAALGARAFAYGGGVLYAALDIASRLAEFDVSTPGRIRLVAQSDILPAPPTALTICNFAGINGARSRYYDSEYLIGGLIGNFILSTNIYWIHNILNVDWQPFVETFPVDFDHNHYGQELDFFWQAPYTGTFLFRVQSNNGVRVYWEQTKVVEQWYVLQSGIGQPQNSGQWEVEADKGARFKVKIEHADQKSINENLRFMRSEDAGVTWIEVDAQEIFLVNRVITRIDTPFLVGPEQTKIGTEMFPDVGGCYAVAPGWLYAFAGGIARQGEHFAIPTCSGACIVETSWKYLLFAVRSGLQLRATGALGTVLVEHAMPFEIDFLFLLQDPYIVAVNRDGRAVVLRVTDDIVYVETHRLRHARHVTGGYAYHKQLVGPATETRLVICERDYGIRRYAVTFDPDGREGKFTFTEISYTPDRGVQDATTNYTGDIVGLSQGDEQVANDSATLSSIQKLVPRRTVSGIRGGEAYAHRKPGLITVYRNEDAPLPAGLESPVLPLPQRQFAFRDGAAGAGTFPGNGGLGQITTTIPVQFYQIAEYRAEPYWTAGDNITVNSLGGLTLDLPMGILIEYAVKHRSAAANPKTATVIQMTVPWYVGTLLQIDAYRPTSGAARFRFYWQGVEQTALQSLATAPMQGGPTGGNNTYAQILLYLTATTLAVWIDGRKIFEVTGLSIPDPMTWTSIVLCGDGTSGNVTPGLSDLRFYAATTLTTDQAILLTGGAI